MKDGWWRMMKDNEGWMVMISSSWGVLITNKRTYICDCRVAFATEKPNDPLLTSRWSLLKCISFKKIASEKGILSELDPKQDSGFSLNLQISDFK